MLKIPKKYIVDEDNNKVAVLINIETYNQIEEILENYGLAKLINEVQTDEKLGVQEAKSYYDSLKKKL